MLQKVIMKKRRSLSGHTKTEERVVRCVNEAEVLKALSGYKQCPGESEVLPPDMLLSWFDSSRPTQEIALLARSGITDNVTLHTLH